MRSRDRMLNFGSFLAGTFSERVQVRFTKPDAKDFLGWDQTKETDIPLRIL